MSSLTRRIQRGTNRHYKPDSPHNKGFMLGVPTNVKAKDLLARLGREEKRERA